MIWIATLWRRTSCGKKEVTQRLRTELDEIWGSMASSVGAPPHP